MQSIDKLKLEINKLLKEEFDFIYVPMATYWTSIINGLLSNPLAGVVLNKFGINRDEFKARINEIKQGYPIGEQTPTMGDSSIKELSDKLKTL